MFGDSILHPKYYLYCESKHQLSSSSAPSSPASSSTALTRVPASTPSSPSYASLMLVAYPQQQTPTMYVAAAQPTYYYAQTTAGQWTPVQTVAQTGPAVSNGAYVQLRTQAPTSSQPTSFIAVPQATSSSGAVVATRQVALAQPQAQVYAQAPQVAYRSSQGPPTIAIPTVRPGLQRKQSAASMHGRRDSFDSQDSRSGILVDREEYNRAPSPVLSEATSSSSGSSSSSASHLNLPRSALNHYTAPQKSRSRRESIVRRGSYDLPGPMTSRQPLALPAPGPQQALIPIHPQPTRSASYPPPSGQLQPQQIIHAEPAFVRPTDLSGRPVSFHEDQNPVYSSYELYNAQPQRGSPSASRPPTIKPSLLRRASSRSLGGGGELSASAYGAGFGMGAGPSMGLMGVRRR